jgi:choice-of-anchor B domain-containing protein
MHDCRRPLASLTPWRAALLLGASLPLLACGAGTGDTPAAPDAASSGTAQAQGAPELALRAHLDLPTLIGPVLSQQGGGGDVSAFHDGPLEIEGADNAAGNWGYTHKDGRRFALTGTSAGLSIVEVTNPKAPRNIGLIPGPASLWREVKTYRDHIYVTTEATHGLDIISMANPDAPVLVRTWNQTFNRAHTVWIDQNRGLAFVNGTRMNSTDTGMRVLNLAANPGNPTEVGFFPGTGNGFYIHDSYSRGNILYASAIYNGWLSRLDVTNPAAITEISRFTTGGAFTHNSWLTNDGSVIFTTDERSGRPMEAWDITNPTSARKIAEYIARPGTIPHNVMVDGDRLLIAHYTEGVHLLDISNAKTPKLLASYDTYLGTSTGFNGCWGAYIFPGSNLILASDMNTGLYVLEYTWR